MKNWLKILIAFSLLVSSPALAATSSGSVNVNATVPYIGGNPIIINGNNPLPTTILQISPALGSLAQACGQANIVWQTQLVTTGGGTTQISDASASTELGYGIDSDNENIIAGAAGVNHLVTLNNLIVGQTYKYYLRSVYNSYERKNSGGVFTANCLVRNPVITVDPVNKGVEIRISYPAGEDIARVVVRRSQQGPPSSPAQGESFYDGEKKDLLTDPFIFKDQIYWYSVFVCNSLNNCSSGVFGQAERAVSEVNGFTVIPGEKRLGLNWSNPADDPDKDFSFANVRLIRPSGNCASAREGDGQVLLEGRLSSFRDFDLINGQNYQYKIFVKNGYGEYSAGLCVNGAPQPVQGRCPANINVSASDKRINLSWVNPADEAGVFQLDNVKWQKSASCPADESQGQTVYSGLGRNFTDADVANGVSYSYAVFADYNNTETASCGCVSAVPVEEEEPKLCPECELTDQSPKLNFFVNDSGLEINPDSQEQLWILSGYDLTIKAIRSLLPKPVSLIAARFDGENYFLSLDSRQDIYQTVMRAPQKAGDYILTVSTVYQDRTASEKKIQLKVLPWGRIYAGQLVKKGVKGAQVYLEKDGGLFLGFGVDNPVLTTASGHYGFMAPNGEYEIEIKADGYSGRKAKVSVKNNIVNLDINLAEGIDPLGEIAALFQALWQNSKIERINTRYAAPGLAVFAFVSIFTGIPWWNFIRYLQFLFTEPLAWFLRRKKKGWGVVYNSITKNPIDLAVARLYDRKTGKLLQSKVTDQEGRYNFLVESGEYYLEASKPGLEFPSKILKDAREDSKYTDIYTGQTIAVAPNQAGAIVVNVPLDQADMTLSDQQILRRHFWKNFRKNVSVIGPVASVVSFIVSPVLITSLFVALHFFLYALFKRLAWGEKPKRWGVVYFKEGNKPLGRVVTRIFSPQYNKMLEAQVTDRYGRYGFLAGNNVYYLTADKDGFSSYRSENLDLSRKKRDEIIGQDIGLEAAKPGAEQKKTQAAPAQETSSLEKTVVKINKEAEDEKEPKTKENKFG